MEFIWFNDLGIIPKIPSSLYFAIFNSFVRAYRDEKYKLNGLFWSTMRKVIWWCMTAGECRMGGGWLARCQLVVSDVRIGSQPESTTNILSVPSSTRSIVERRLASSKRRGAASLADRHFTTSRPYTGYSIVSPLLVIETRFVCNRCQAWRNDDTRRPSSSLIRHLYSFRFLIFVSL